MTKLPLIVAVIIVTVASFGYLGLLNAKENIDPDNKTVAWYVAHIRDARLQNQACHDQPGLKDTANCINSLHALEISFTGGN